MISDFIQNSQLINDEELIFFGGSFNPWHAGHASCIKLMPKNKSIIVIPDHSPFKEITASENKFSSIEEIQDQLKKFEQNTVLFDEFFYLDKKNPTINWIKELKIFFPNKKLSLLMGFDSFVTIDRWTDAKALLNLLDTIYVASRLDDKKIKEDQLSTLKKINPQLNIKFLGGHPFESISSTEIRKTQSRVP